MTEADPQLAQRIGALLRNVPDFPEPGVQFKDIAPLLADGTAFAAVIDALAKVEGAADADLVAGVEARGFLLAGALATRLDCGLVPVRKAGKLPPPTARKRYDLEYGSAEIEVPIGVLDGKRVLLVDDVLATGGTLRAAAELIDEAGGHVVSLAVIAELTALGGRAVVGDERPLSTLVSL